jgi:DNA-binding response OmpR family regulator
VRILVVDDEFTTRTMLQHILARQGHEVVAAEDGSAACRAAAAGPFSIVVTDWLMPGTDGLQLTRFLREAPPHPYSYVILLTSVEGRAEWLRAMEAGVDDFVPKPVDEDVLLARIHVAERILGLMERNRTLARFIPICMYCKKARTDRDFWMELDHYLTESGDARLSHGVCPECNVKHVLPMIEDYERNERARQDPK